MKKLLLIIIAAISTVLVFAAVGCGNTLGGSVPSDTTSTAVAATVTESSLPASTTSSDTTSTAVTATNVGSSLPEDSDVGVEDLMGRLDARADSDLELYRTITGTGDKEAIELPMHPATPLLVHFVGEGAEGHAFGVTGVDYTNGYMSILANSSKAVDGYAPLDWYEGADTFELSVTAIGPWTLDILPMDAMKTVGARGTIKGDCNYVVRVEGSPSALRIKGDGGGIQFHVEMHTENGVAVLADTAGLFNKRVKVSGGGILVISADEPWTITIED